ncbi:hypothetical protein [Stenotrophomonas sp. 22385]|uniref:hypothetical protein n=1 Tax=Stenotrophomonas sp. 22385 TaxID=3453915 RepID=UPI003F83B8FB
MPQPTSPSLHNRVDSPGAGRRWPLLGTASWLVAPAILAAAYAVAQAAPEMGRLLVGSAGVAVGVLASSVLGLLLTIGSRVRRERWPWVGIVGAVISALPLLLFLAGMLFRL